MHTSRMTPSEKCADLH